jgi:multidrug resistance protein MdtO
MAAAASSAPDSISPFAWLWDLVREELAPYPGRVALVARMVTAATLVMIVNMTFRIPYGAYGAIYALTISRESPQATVRFVKTIVIAFAVAAADVLVGAFFFVNEPLDRFLWVIGTLFLMFYALSAWTDYVASARFGYLLVITIPLWDRQIPAQLRVEDTLWAVGALTIASVITALLELAFAALTPGDEVTASVAGRLSAIEELLTSYAQGRQADKSTEKSITRYVTVGTSRLRRILQRSDRPPQYREQMGAAIALIGRLTDIAASLMYIDVHAGAEDRQRIRALTERIAGIRAGLLGGRVPPPVEVHVEGESQATLPVLREMENTVKLIPQVFLESQPLSARYPLPSSDEHSSALFVPDAFSNPEHLKFALKGCLAASLCYVIYNALFWPGISTAITTCLLTALTTIGASHQKQVLRFAGALAGGAIAMGAQVFILPSLDSIGSFTILFIAVTAATAWVATSSPRLSYFGVQVAVAIYLINLQEFKIQTSLTVARDRVAGILLGLLMMWLVFDQLWGTSAGREMKRTFILNLRMLARLAREPGSANIRVAVARSYSLRDTINKNLDKVRALADGVLFEFGPSRQQDLDLRNRIRKWLPEQRIIFLLRITLLKYRLGLPGFVLPEAMRPAQEEFDSQFAEVLENMANRMEGRIGNRPDRFEHAFERLQEAARICQAEPGQGALTAYLPTFLALSRTITELTMSLDRELA